MHAHRSIWLLLALEDERWARDLIDRLAAELGTPCFQPHLTLLGDVSLPEQTLSDQLQQAAAASAPIQAQIAGIEYLDEFFRAFFLRIEDHPVILDLHQSLRNGCDVSAQSRFMPHVSLLYGDLQEALKSGLHARLSAGLTNRSVRFDRAALVHAAKGVAIEDWTILETFPLGRISTASV